MSRPKTGPSPQVLNSLRYLPMPSASGQEVDEGEEKASESDLVLGQGRKSSIASSRQSILLEDQDSILEETGPEPSADDKLNSLLRLGEQQWQEIQNVHRRMAVIEEKLSKALLLPSEPHLISQGSSASIISRHSKPINSKISKPETPEISSARLSDFDDIDQMLGERVMKSAMKNSSWKRSGTHLGASMGLTSMAMSAKSVSIANILPQTIPSASDEDGPGVSLAKAQDLGISTSDQAHQIIPPNVPETPKSNASNSHAASLSNVFRHREVQLIPVSTATNGTSLRIPSDVPESHSHGGL